MSRPGYRSPSYLTDEDITRATSATGAVDELIDWLRQLDEDEAETDPARRTWVGRVVAQIAGQAVVAVAKSLAEEQHRRAYHDAITRRAP